MIIKPSVCRYAGNTIISKNSPVFSGASENTSLEHSGQTLLKPVQHSVGSGAASPFQMLVPVALVAGAAAYAFNSSFQGFTGSMISNMNGFGDTLIRKLPHKARDSWMKSGFNWLCRLALPGVSSFYGSKIGVYDEMVGELQNGNLDD
jgi:hypothetical protein